MARWEPGPGSTFRDAHVSRQKHGSRCDSVETPGATVLKFCLHNGLITLDARCERLECGLVAFFERTLIPLSRF